MIRIFINVRLTDENPLINAISPGYNQSRDQRDLARIDRLYNADDFCALILLALGWIDAPTRGYLGQETQFAE